MSLLFSDRNQSQNIRTGVSFDRISFHFIFHFHFSLFNHGSPPGGLLCIFWVRGRVIGKGIDFHDFGIRNGIDFHDFGIRNGIDFRNFRKWYRVGYAFSENWYKVGYIFLKNWYKVGYTFWKNWYKERVCF